MPEPSDLAIEVLKQIRHELAQTRTELGARIDQTNARLEENNTRLSAVETTLLDLAEQQRFVVRHLSTRSSRDRRIEDDVDELRGRVEALEKRMASR